MVAAPAATAAAAASSPCDSTNPSFAVAANVVSSISHTVKKKLKILCLPGYCSSAYCLQEQLALANFASLKPIAEFETLQPPMPAANAYSTSVMLLDPDGPYGKWWEATVCRSEHPENCCCCNSAENSEASSINSFSQKKDRAEYEISVRNCLMREKICCTTSSSNCRAENAYRPYKNNFVEPSAANSSRACSKLRLVGLDVSLAHLSLQLLKADPPYDGIMGFSQGAALAHIACLLRERRSPLFPQSSFSFAIFIGGFIPQNVCCCQPFTYNSSLFAATAAASGRPTKGTAVAPTLDPGSAATMPNIAAAAAVAASDAAAALEESEKIPPALHTLHVWGVRDPLRPRSQAAFEWYSSFVSAAASSVHQGSTTATATAAAEEGCARLNSATVSATSKRASPVTAASTTAEADVAAAPASRAADRKDGLTVSQIEVYGSFVEAEKLDALRHHESMDDKLKDENIEFASCSTTSSRIGYHNATAAAVASTAVASAPSSTATLPAAPPPRAASPDETGTASASSVDTSALKIFRKVYVNKVVHERGHVLPTLHGRVFDEMKIFFEAMFQEKQRKLLN